MPRERDGSPDDRETELSSAGRAGPHEHRKAAPLRSPIPGADETLDGPLAGFLHHTAAAADPNAWLSRWLLLTGTVAASLSVAAIVAALSLGARPVGWKGPLIAFDCAVVVLIVRSFLAAGVPAETVCHRLFSVAGLTTGSLVILGTLLRSAVSFIQGRSPADLLPALLLFSLLGLTTALVFVQCLQGRAWACRSAAVSSAALLVLLALQPFAGFGLRAKWPTVPLEALRSAAVPSAAVGLCAVGFMLALGAARRRPRHRPLLHALAWVWMLILGGATALCTALLVRQHGAAPASARLWAGSVLWAGAALSPLLLAGLVLAWRRRGPVLADMHATTTFVCSFVALGGLVCLGLWVPLRLHAGVLHLLLVAAGVLAALTGAWLTETSGDWVSRWALAPAVALATGVLCSPAELLAFAQGAYAPQDDLGRLAAAYLWCLLVVVLAFAAAGLLARRYRLRALRPQEALTNDVRLVCLAGWTLSGLSLAAACALIAGDPVTAGAVRRTLAQVWMLGRDLLILGAGRAAARWLTQALALLSPILSRPAFVAIGIGLVLAILVVHLAAASRLSAPPGRRAHWSLSLTAALWMVALSLAGLFVLLYASHLFLPSRESGLGTLPGRFVSTHFTARLLLFIALTGLLVRFWEAVGSVLRVPASGPGAPAAAAGAVQQTPASQGRPVLKDSRHLHFLVHLGVLAAGTGLVLAFLLRLTPEWEALLFELSNLGRICARAGVSFGISIGRLAAQWVGFAAAAALTAYGLICIHEEGRRGRTEVYAFLGAAWALPLVLLIKEWVAQVRTTLHPPAPGRAAALAVAAVVLAGLSAAAAALLAGRRRAQSEGDRAGAPDGRGAWAAQSLGSLGLLASLAMSLVIIHGALSGSPYYDQALRWAGDRAAVLVAKGATCADTLRGALDHRGSLGPAATGLLLASSAVLLLHFLAARRVSWARGALYLLWFAAALAGAAGLGYMIHLWPLGTWTAPQLFLGLLLAAVVIRLVAALLRPRSWLLPAGD